MIKKSGLGRGLDKLLSSANSESVTDASQLKLLAVEKISPSPYQPRKNIAQEGLQSLADSIKAQGLVQPIVVRKLADGQYELIAGERRWRASQLAGLLEIPAIVRELPDQAAAAMALIENIQREDLNALEEAQALNRLIHEFGLTHQQTAEAVGRSRAAVSNLLRLLELESQCKVLLEEGKLEMGHARALLALQGKQQIELAHKVAQYQLSVRATEKLVKQTLAGELQAIIAPKPTLNADISQLQSRLADTLGAKVSINHSKRGKGKLVIEYNSLDELDGILAHIH
ncbi:MAG: ParB/RepB/Spo0J family partition protein [Thiotrichaceae bacterium]|uniref:Probable chromosome-partitioning protein ParB n=1 Tax=Candidatus Thiocaldithrix dubininis TaxID=3080823 RepID=A0AA95H5P3_9GAMM|nr:MAG: ParB/RepB/Spo0J family partition protein [Candidatus Thiocaldithrix dubininis]